MYNINSHYTNIFNLACSLINTPSMMYLHPHGATEIKDLESIHTETNDMLHISDAFIMCYDQEPIIPSYNKTLFSHVKKLLSRYLRDNKSIILLNTELDSDDKDELISQFNLIDCYYFHHIFAAHDWFREYYYNKNITAPSTRKLTKKFISMNRLTSNARVYRTLFINELISKDILHEGYVSYSKECPHGGDFKSHLFNNKNYYNIPYPLIQETIRNIEQSTHSFRIDYKDDLFIPNRSFSVDPIDKFIESFVHVVTETNYWGRKKHLTEKIFKPIILKQPFILVGCANNLEYLKSYGFKTFNRWWDESYDNITDDIQRMDAIGSLLQSICRQSTSQLESILCDMQETLDYNYNLFYSREFINSAWNELEVNLATAISQLSQ